jgi:hypothetical protein
MAGSRGLCSWNDPLNGGAAWRHDYETATAIWKPEISPLPAWCATPHANLVKGMRWLLSAYTIRLNHRHKLFGHVFSGRYKALLAEGSGNGYLKTACDYVHLKKRKATALLRRSCSGGVGRKRTWRRG